MFSLIDASSEENEAGPFVPFLFRGQCAEHQAAVLPGIMRDSFIPMQPGIVVMVAAHMMFNGKLASNFNLSTSTSPKSPFFPPLNWV